ncbi:hypothetical protein HY061_01535 [Candidatus Azambacteria bacterium]|nr:hypothetical protein [Candidatus Azambacteria bacterium]
MEKIATRDQVIIPKSEYVYLKKLADSFEEFFCYFRQLKDIEEARMEVKQKKIISQEKLFKKLGF